MKFIQLGQQMNILKGIQLSVIADRDCPSIDFAKKNHIPAEVISYHRNDNGALKRSLEKLNPDIIVTTWAKIIDKELVSEYSGKMINLHYSLLPAFSGQMGTEPIENAYRQNCQYIGTTCHYVNENVDAGTIISQAILKTDIPIEKAIQEVFKKGCMILLNSIMIISDKIFIETSDNNSFTYSPKLKYDEALFDNLFWEKLASL
jgi:phosphoribosylglycinamide formyltransferase-1